LRLFAVRRAHTVNRNGKAVLMRSAALELKAAHLLLTTCCPAKAPWTFLNEPPLAWMARIGYLARGTVFLIVRTFALLAALGASHSSAGMTGALQDLGKAAGGALLWMIAVLLWRRPFVP
jgi:hypothetical protein